MKTSALILQKNTGLKPVAFLCLGAAGGAFSNDIHIKIGRERWELECKKRATGFAFLYDNLEGADALIVAADRKKPLAVIDYDDFLNLLAGKL